MSNQELIEKFYTSFQKKDYQGMQSCYHENITFSDPAFPNLKGKEAGAMWEMLCSVGGNLEITFNNLKVAADSGSVHWEAKYKFSATGRFVHNKIDATFRFSDGKIIAHTDYFNFWKWSKMALGTPGMLLGWSSFLQNKVQKTAGEKLEKFIKKGANI